MHLPLEETADHLDTIIHLFSRSVQEWMILYHLLKVSSDTTTAEPYPYILILNIDQKNTTKQATCIDSKNPCEPS